MNLTIALTFDGLIRALRWKMHNLAEDTEERYVSGEPAIGAGAPRRFSATRPETTTEPSDDRPGR
jgi:hypothetical protein